AAHPAHAATRARARAQPRGAGPPLLRRRLRGARPHHRRAREEPAAQDRGGSRAPDAHPHRVRDGLPLRAGAMTRIRTRILLGTLLVVATTLALGGLLARRVTHQQVERLLVDARRPPPVDLRPLADYRRAHGSW